ncbi:roadblock/LC7 domain-containing protein [Nocardioides xinjiangensis]|uniref:hypothetical protein n=1 Tax=Nocardioides xinjiangensis TaxID=2817376 RepID=UPI001B304803|nr:hypothetical protein [Nocardioides sp. SYSU D00778]
MSDKYDAILEDIAAGVNGFIGASIVDLESGMPLATKATRDFDLDTASAYNSELVKAKLNTMRILNLSGLEDMLLTLQTQLHLIKLVGTEAFIYVAADRQSTNLALLRSAVNRAAVGLG